MAALEAEGIPLTAGQRTGNKNLQYMESNAVDMPLIGGQAARLRDAPLTAKGARDYSRVFFASAHDDVPDKQGRVTVPPPLREYAGLDRDCTVIGANTRVEIWDAAAWTSYLAEQEDGFATLSEEVLPGLM